MSPLACLDPRPLWVLSVRFRRLNGQCLTSESKNACWNSCGRTAANAGRIGVSASGDGVLGFADIGGLSVGFVGSSKNSRRGGGGDAAGVCTVRIGFCAGGGESVL